MARSTFLSSVRMPNKRLSMRQIKEILHYGCQRSQREIASTIGASVSTVWEYLQRAKRTQLSYE